MSEKSAEMVAKVQRQTAFNEDVRRMGYRMIFWEDKSLYAKPWGFTLITIDPESRLISQWYQGVGDSGLRLWNETTLPDEEVLYAIKDFESEGTRQHLGRSDTNFDFLDTMQVAEKMLEG